MNHKQVYEVMDSRLTSVTREATLASVIQEIAGTRIGMAVVVDNQRPVGLIVDYDLLGLYAKGSDLATTRLADLDLPTPKVVTVDDTLAEVVHQYTTRRLRRFPVIDRDGYLVGGITEKELFGEFAGNHLIDKERVASLMRTDIATAPLDATCRDLLGDLLRLRSGCVFMVDAQGRPHGLVTERDLVRLLAKQGHLNVPAQAIMSQPVTQIHDTEPVKAALDQFLGSGHRRLAVIDDLGRLKGMFNLSHLLGLVFGAQIGNGATLAPDAVGHPALWVEWRGGAVIDANQAARGLLGWKGLPSSIEKTIPATLWQAATVLLGSSDWLETQLPIKGEAGREVATPVRIQAETTLGGKKRLRIELLGSNQS